MSTRQGTEPGGGLGLGLFIAKTLLERSGATIRFRNSPERGEGAVVEIVWPRAAFAAPEALASRAGSADRPAHQGWIRLAFSGIYVGWMNIAA